jgi:hypothetical protein
MKNKSAAITRDSLMYVKAYRQIAKTVTATILFQQLEWRFSKYPEGFYKFMKPSPNHQKYKLGDSWMEELGFSREEFRTAFDAIGIRYNSKTEYLNRQKEGNTFIRRDESGNDTTEALYCSYHDRNSGLTFHLRNHDLVDRRLEEITHSVKGEPSSTVERQPSSTVEEQPQLTVEEDPRSMYSGDPPLPIILHADTTTETTHTQKNGAPQRAGVCVGSKFSLEECRRYTEHLKASGQGVNNPGGLALSFHRSGEADSLIASFLNPPLKLDVSACPDCEGRGMFYVDPANHDKGVKPCRHEKLKAPGGGDP